MDIGARLRSTCVSTAQSYDQARLGGGYKIPYVLQQSRASYWHCLQATLTKMKFTIAVLFLLAALSCSNGAVTR